MFAPPFRILAPAACAAALLTSCSLTGTARVSTAQLPAAWRNAAGFPMAEPERDLSRWWASFNDARMSSLIRSALAGNRDLAGAMARVHEARARRESERASLFPTFGYEGTIASTRSDSDAAGSRSETSYSAGLNASWEPDFFGKNRNAVLAASRDAQAANENLNSARAALAAETALAYIDLRNSEERLRIVQRAISTREETARIASWRATAGQIDQLELRQAQAGLESARSSLATLRQSIGQAENRLALLCGTAPGGISTGSGGIPSPRRKLAVGIPADTIRQRPDVRAAGYSWAAAVSRTKAAEAERLPSLRLTGTLGIDSVSGSKLFRPEAAAASLIAGITGPIFDGGRIRANIAAQNAATDQALHAYEQAVLTALSEVENALIACKRSAERIGSLRKAVAAAGEASTLASQRYEAGVIDMTTVLDTQRNDLALQETLATARADHATAHAQLYKALGGGW